MGPSAAGPVLMGEAPNASGGGLESGASPAPATTPTVTFLRLSPSPRLPGLSNPWPCQEPSQVRAVVSATHVCAGATQVRASLGTKCAQDSRRGFVTPHSLKHAGLHLSIGLPNVKRRCEQVSSRRWPSASAFPGSDEPIWRAGPSSRERDGEEPPPVQGAHSAGPALHPAQ